MLLAACDGRSGPRLHRRSITTEPAAASRDPDPNLYNVLRFPPTLPHTPVSATRPTPPTTRKAATITALRTATRVYGALTTAYGLYALGRPQHLSRQLGVNPQTASRLGRALGLRDLASGLAIALAPTPDAVRGGLVARTTFDSLDAVGFGVLAPTADGGRKAAGVAAVWGALGAALLLAHGRVPARDQAQALTVVSAGDAS